MTAAERLPDGTVMETGPNWEYQTTLETGAFTIKIAAGYYGFAVKGTQSRLTIYIPENGQTYDLEMVSFRVPDPNNYLVETVRRINDTYASRDYVEARIQQADEGYLHHQDVSSNIWVIRHGKGRIVDVSLVDSAGNKFLTDIKQEPPYEVAYALMKHPRGGKALVK